MKYFSSDLHFNHNIIVPKYRKFSSQEEHDNIILDKIAKLKKREILTLLGDTIFDGPRYQWYIDQLNKMACRIQLVFGNHDSLKLYKEPKFEIQLPLYSYKNLWVSHCPIHPSELRNRDGNIHGHLHTKDLDDPRYINVCIDYNNYNFVHFDEIIERIKK